MNMPQSRVIVILALTLSVVRLAACSGNGAPANAPANAPDSSARPIPITLVPTATSDVPLMPTPALLAATAEPPATPMPITPPTAGAINSPEGQLICAGAGLYRQCRDQVLQISFDIPFAWGAITTTYKSYSDSFNTGNEYKYQFGGVLLPNGDPLMAQAGGTSKVFVLARDGDKTSFNGFAAAPVSCVSSKELVNRCIKLSDIVILQLSMDGHTQMCNLNPYKELEPLARVYIDLPDNPKISGFVFLLNASTTTSSKTLRDSLGVDGADNLPDGCKTDAVTIYDTEVEKFLQSLEEGTADVDDQQLFGQIRHLAESIKPFTVP